MSKIKNLYNDIKRKINFSVDDSKIHYIINEAYNVFIDLAIQQGKFSEISELVCTEKLKQKTKNKDSIIYERPKDCLYEINYTVLAKECEERELTVCIISPYDWRKSKKDELLCPSFDWCETIGRTTKEGIEIAFKDFKINEAWIDFYKKPETLAFPSCTKDKKYVIEGKKITEDVEPEICKSFQLNMISSIAALIAARDANESNDYQTQLNNLINIYNASNNL